MAFKPLDLLAPWGICLGSAGLCIAGTVKYWGQVPGYICMAVAAAFVAGIPLWYRIRNR
jgi:hypothetical protein